MVSPTQKIRQQNFGSGVKIMVALTATVLALAAGEWAVRGFALVPEIKSIHTTGHRSVYKRSANPILGYELKANYRDNEADLSFSYPLTNAHGLRDFDRSIEKPAGVRRVLLLGDSVVEGEGIREIADTMSGQLEAMFTDDNTQVLNFGVSGYCTRAEVELLEVKGLQFQPDLVVLVFVQNDFDNFNREAFQLESDIARSTLVKHLFARSELFRLICIKMNLFQFGAELDPVNWNRRAMGDNNVVDGLQRLSALAMGHEFQPMIAIWPLFYDDRVEDVHILPDTEGELVIERLASVAAIPTFRFSTDFQSHMVSVDGPLNPRLRYTLGDKLHPSMEGCQIAARALKAMIDSLENDGYPPDTRPGADPGQRRNARARELASVLGSTQPDYSRLYNNQGNAFRAQCKLEEAIQQYQEALRVNPELAEAHHNLASILVGQGKLNEAIRHYRAALDIDGDLAEAHYRLAVALGWTGQVDGARIHFKRATQLVPDWADPLNGLAWVLATHPELQSRDAQTAIELAQQAVALTDRQDAASLDTLAAAYASADQFEQAVAIVGEALVCARRDKEESLVEEIRLRRELYRREKPYRQPGRTE